MSCLRTGSSTRDTASVHGLLENNSISDKLCDQTEQNLSVEALDSGSLGPHTHCTAMKQSMMLTNRETSELPCEKHPCSALVVACSPLSLRHNCSTPSSSCDRISVLCLHQIVPISHILQDSLTVRSLHTAIALVHWHPTILDIVSGHVLGRRLLPADKQFQGVIISSPQLMLTSVLPLRVSMHQSGLKQSPQSPYVAIEREGVSI